jgi:hypothetical protein
MALTDLWINSRTQLEDKHIQQITAIPANGLDALCDDDVGGICWRFDLNVALMSMLKRPNLSAGGAENLLQASSGHTSHVTNGNRRAVLLTS